MSGSRVTHLETTKTLLLLCGEEDDRPREPGVHGAAASLSDCSHALLLVPHKLPYSREHANHQMCHR